MPIEIARRAVPDSVDDRAIGTRCIKLYRSFRLISCNKGYSSVSSFTTRLITRGIIASYLTPRLLRETIKCDISCARTAGWIHARKLVPSKCASIACLCARAFARFSTGESQAGVINRVMDAAKAKVAAAAERALCEIIPRLLSSFPLPRILARPPVPARLARFLKLLRPMPTTFNPETHARARILAEDSRRTRKVDRRPF